MLLVCKLIAAYQASRPCLQAKSQKGSAGHVLKSIKPSRIYRSTRHKAISARGGVQVPARILQTSITARQSNVSSPRCPILNGATATLSESGAELCVTSYSNKYEELAGAVYGACSNYLESPGLWSRMSRPHLSRVLEPPGNNFAVFLSIMARVLPMSRILSLVDSATSEMSQGFGATEAFHA